MSREIYCCRRRSDRRLEMADLEDSGTEGNDRGLSLERLG